MNSVPIFLHSHDEPKLDISLNASVDEAIDKILSELGRTSSQCYVFESLPNELNHENLVNHIVNLMIHYGLAEVYGDVYGTTNIPLLIKPFGSYILHLGGWLKYLETQKAENEMNALRLKNEMEKTQLEKEKLNYEKQIRSLQEKVQNLTVINLKLQNSQIIITALCSLIVGVVTWVFEHFGVFKKIFNLFSFMIDS